MVHKKQFSHAITQWVDIQKNLTHKLHYRPNLKELYHNNLVGYTVANHFTRHGYTKRVYLLLLKQYVLLLRTFVMPNSLNLESEYVVNTIGFDNLGFFREYKDELIMRNLHYALVWQAVNIKPIVRLDSFLSKKQYQTRLRYVKPERRFFLV